MLQRTESASGIRSLKFIFSYIEQKIESIQNLKKKKEKQELHELLTHGRCATLSHYPQAKNTVTPVNNIFCFIHYLNRLCSSAPKLVTRLTSQKQGNQIGKVPIRASSPSPPRASRSLPPDVYLSSSGDVKAYKVKRKKSDEL